MEPINAEDKKGDMQNLTVRLRPVSPDDLPIVGPMAHYPNVILNAGHGGRGLGFCFASAKLV